MAQLSTPKAFLFPAAILLLTACAGDPQDDRQQEQQVVRAQRLSRARAQRARRARLERNRQRDGSQPTRASGSPPSPVTLSNPCDPGTELKRRAGSSLFNDRFAQALRLVAAPIRADLVELEGKPIQRFTFTVRMHPDDAPRFHRPLRRAELLLDLRFSPVCGQGGVIRKSVQLRVRVEKGAGKKSRSKTTTSLWPQRSRGASFAIPVGAPIQLLLDPTQATLRGGERPKKGSTTLGLWEILAARFAGRPRTARLSLATSGLPASLRQLHVIEVVCGKKRDKQCRFLTRIQGRRARVTSWKELVTLAAPIQTMARVRQLHAAELSLRFPRCGGDARRPTPQQTAKKGGTSRCFGRSAHHRACQFWRAQHGYGNEAVITSNFSGFAVRHVIACPGKKLQVLELHATYKRKGHHSLTVRDLTPRASQLLQDVRRLTSTRRR